jgi:hypothetical protein
MCIISFDKEALNITIHNHYPGLGLASPVYCSNNAVYYVSPNQQTDTSNTIGASFEMDSEQYCFKGALLYKLQKKHTTKTDNQTNSSVASVEDTVTNTYLSVVWSVDDCEHIFRVWLIECVDDFAWNEDILWAFYMEYFDTSGSIAESSISEWLMNDGVVMKIRRDVTYGSDCKLDIVISEGTGRYNMEKSMKINLKG